MQCNECGYIFDATERDYSGRITCPRCFKSSFGTIEPKEDKRICVWCGLLTPVSKLNHNGECRYCAEHALEEY